MPIYAYQCTSCGTAKDVLRKISDPPLTLCPACGKDTLVKQVTAAGFQLKGSGWYVTDFRGGNTGAPSEAKSAEKADGASEKAASDTSPGDANKGATTGDTAPAPTAAKQAPAAATSASTPTPSPSPSTSASGATS